MFKPIEAVASSVQTYCPGRRNIGVVQETHDHMFPVAPIFEVVTPGRSYSMRRCSGYVELAPHARLRESVPRRAGQEKVSDYWPTPRQATAGSI